MYQESNITDITDIPPLVSAFAASAGWTVTGTSGSPILTRPGGGMSFQLTAAISSFDHTLAWAENGGSTATSSAKFTSPKLNGTVATPDVSIPSKVHLFGDTDPEPFLCIVVEYGFNSYRHLYLGNMEKIGAYTGGEVISAQMVLASTSNAQYPIEYRKYAEMAYLFGSYSSVLGASLCGGVHVAHADNPTPWRKFYRTASSTPMTTFDSTVALGGFGDDINDGYLARGKSSFAGAQILVPINLYASKPVTGDTRFVPLGAPAGVRLVHMEDITPGYEFTIGSQDWKCFPAVKKSFSTSVGKDSDGWALDETSYFVGYAYPMN